MITMPNRDRLVRMRATIEILLWRHGVLPVLAGLAVLAAVLVWAWLVPSQYAALAKADQDLQTLSSSAGQRFEQARARPPSSLKRFQMTLSKPADTNEILRDIFMAAQDAGIVVAQAEYRRLADTHDSYSQLQIAMPVRAQYPAFKRFCELLLQRVPSLSIDQMTVRREASDSVQLEVQLIMSLWQTPMGGVSEARPAARGDVR